MSIDFQWYSCSGEADSFAVPQSSPSMRASPSITKLPLSVALVN
jgi:hypothetical protein